MEITFFTSMLDAALQAQQIDDAIARKFDLVVVVPTSEQAVVPALARAKQAGVPIIIVNNTPKDGTEELYLTFVGQDQTAMGRLAGEAMLKALKDSGRDGGKVAMITGALQQGIAPRRVNGFREAVKANPKVEIVAVEDARWDTATSERIAGQLYARFAADRRPRRSVRHGGQPSCRSDPRRGSRRHCGRRQSEATHRGRRQLPEGGP